MSEMSESDSSGLSDWALVNCQGELEGSDVDSNSSSIEVMGLEEAAPDATTAPGYQGNTVCRDGSPECIELEHLMKAADEAAVEETEVNKVDQSSSSPEVAASMPSLTASDSQALGACCPELLKESEEKSPSRDLGEAVSSDTCSTCASSSSGDSVVTSSDDSISASLSESACPSASRSTKSDSDNESDFVRLEKDSSSANVTESEEEEVQALPASRRHSTSSSSVGSGFNFLGSCRASSSPPPLAAPPLPAEIPAPPPSPPRPPALLCLPSPANNIVEDADDDADTESSTEQEEDDRIESEQSDDAHSAPPNDEDQADLSLVGDIGDLPLVRGSVERHYIHKDNPQLNGKLNCVVVTVILVVFGLGLGHWIGSTREHFSQMEIQLAQLRRLHQMQDEYVQCLSRNDELLVSGEGVLQGERDRHQEAMADLRDNNSELQEQLQDAQDQLEALLSEKRTDASGKPDTETDPSLASNRLFTTLEWDSVEGELTISELLFAGEEVFQDFVKPLTPSLRSQLVEARQLMERMFKGSEADKKQAFDVEQERSELILARQRVNMLELENEELRLAVARQRYEHHPGNPSSGPPPPPIAPPPLACPSQEDLDDLMEENTRLKTELFQYQKQTEDESKAFAYTDNTSPGIDEHEKEDEDPVGVTIEVEEEEPSPQPEYIPPDSHGRCGSDIPQPVPIDVTLLQRNLSQERQRADMWRRLYLTQQERDKQGSSVKSVNASACLQYLAQHMNASALLDYMSRWNMSGTGVDDFANLTFLLSSISELQHNLMESLPSLWHQLSSTLRDIHSDFLFNSEGEYDEGPAERSDKDETESREGDGEKENASGRGKKWSDSVRSLLNKTRATMSNVSRQLQNTWGKVKEASQHLWPQGDSVISRMAARVSEGMTKFSHKLQKKASSWFRKRDKRGQRKSNWRADADEKEAPRYPKNGANKPKPPKYERPKRDGKVPNRHVHQHHHEAEKRDKVHVNQHAFGADTADKKEQKKDEKIPAFVHRQHGHPHPTPHSAENNRKFHKAKHHWLRDEKSASKAQKKFRKYYENLVKKIASMDERRFRHMDSDAIEDMVEDLEKLDAWQQHSKGNMDLNVLWLHCQHNWWRMAEQRQYIAEDDCWRYLAPWQNAMFNIYPSQQNGRAPKSAGTSAKGNREEEEPDVKDQDNRGQGVKNVDRSSSDQPGKYNSSDEHQGWYFRRVQVRNKHRRDEHRADWMFDRARDRDAARRSERAADWFFERAAERRLHRQADRDSDWLFDRAAHRDKARHENDQFGKGYFKRHGNNYRQKYGKASCGLG